MSELTITTKALAVKAGLPVPSSMLNYADDFILVYDSEDDLVTWGPEDQREQVLRLARVYE